jgi:hypothetical protein
VSGSSSLTCAATSATTFGAALNVGAALNASSSADDAEMFSSTADISDLLFSSGVVPVGRRILFFILICQ